ncbi:MAG TPA: SpoIIE family protein phosphatase [Spirochaetota bacterium]
MELTTGEVLIAAFDKVRQNLKAGYIEIIHTTGGKPSVIGVKAFDEGVEFLPYEKLIETEEYKKENAAVFSFSTTHKEKPLHCLVARIKGGNLLTVLLESKVPFDPSTLPLAEFSHAVTDLALGQTPTPSTADVPTKTDLINMRQIQAMLFPKFEDIKGFDIGAVYLPSQLMSGNFIDAFPLNEDLLQVCACVVGGYDASASFIGAAVRTLFRSLSGPSIIPSALIETLNQRLSRMVSGIHYLVGITVFQLNLKTGKVSTSSLGPISTLFYIVKKKSAIDLGDTQIGKDLAKRTVFKDISFMLDPGDTILYYSEGVLNAEKEDGSAVFGKQNLYDKFRIGIDLPSREHVHAIAQSVFEYINYAPIRDDILLVRVKRS